MYIPPANSVTGDAEIRALVAAAQTGWLVTADADAMPIATLLPVMWSGETVVAHMAKANPHWQTIQPGTPGLLICSGPDAYVSPNWYAAKAEHGRVVPTWNYSAVHLTGAVTIHDDRDWLLDAVTELTDLHEGKRPDRWKVTDAPERYLAGQLHGIVGVEFAVANAEAKAKLSQNRSEADQRGVIAGLLDEDPVVAPHARSVATAMTKTLGGSPSTGD